MGSLGNLIIWMFQGFTGSYVPFSPDDAVDIITKVFKFMGPAIDWTLYILEFMFYWLFTLMKIPAPPPTHP